MHYYVKYLEVFLLCYCGGVEVRNPFSVRLILGGET